MLISLDHPVLLKVIKALQRRYWYTHHLWGQCLNRIQDQLHQRRQAGNIDIHIDEIISVLNSTIQTVRNETLTEADIIQIAENMFDDNDRIWPDGFYIDRLVRQFGIDSEAIPAPEGEQYIPPLGLRWWPEIFRPSSYCRRLDATVFELFQDIHRLLRDQSRTEDDIRELLLAQGRAEDDSWTRSLDFRARDCRVYDRMARLVRLDGNERLLELITPLAETLEFEVENMHQGTAC